MIELCPCLYAQCVDANSNSGLNVLLLRRFVLGLNVLLLQLGLESRQLFNLFLEFTQQLVVVIRPYRGIF